MNANKFLFSTIILLFISNGLFAQTINSVLKPSDKVVYYGIDMSASKLIGDRSSPEAVFVSTVMPGMNYTVISQPEKFDFQKYFNISSLTEAIASTDKVNSTVDIDNFYSNEASYNPQWDEKQLAKHIAKLSKVDKGNKGFVFIVESMNKIAEKSAVWIVVFDNKTSEILYSKRYLNDVGGFGQKNYYLKPITLLFKKH
ncbi:MAG: hypothetical protein IPM04_04140 [Saprospiraceae bacterium]|nr:hypothetical protein [Candidatus Brachybacter algidus]MBK8747062.1 hypothetical protein [Candidatus Brachybacter algidus]